MAPLLSLNPTNLRLAALTFMLLLAVLWTLSANSNNSETAFDITSPDAPVLAKPDNDVPPLSATGVVAPSSLPSPSQVPVDPFVPPPELNPPPDAGDLLPPDLLPPDLLPPDLLPPDLAQPPSPDGINIMPSGFEPLPTPPPNPDNLPPLPTHPDPSLPPPPEGDLGPDGLIHILPVQDVSTPENTTTGSGKGRLLIVYAYAESEAARANLAYFVEKGLHGAADFVFIFNGNASAASLVPALPNVRTVHRENTCYDLGAIGEVLRDGDLWKQYSRFITMNASIRGPFLPVWSAGTCWSDLYLNRVTDKTKLVGMTLNCKPRPHVQSMIFATDAIGMAVLLDPAQAVAASVDDQFGKSTDPVGLSGCYNSHNSAVHAEVGTSGLITAAGYEFDAMMAALHSHASPEEFCTANPDAGDLLFDGSYFGSNVHPYETVFIKANRNIDGGLLTHLTEWHMSMKTTSFDSCGVI
ncbi:hypothetical protein B0H66DRAFT_216713 [Apodospora peruviana]|uniref:Uncharacterized protein n=1 Tax=Apodospora peruviana TaxID=516989 RepID=A0AAE0M864_9PEZI|nr:hypothetical protein B0H66DRAFT_216713 [Apodospora peruviana]